MKDKPHSHRSTNTFRFKGFHQKVKNIRINSRNFILKKLESEGEAETLFWQTILKWRELNLTIGFREFQEDLGNEVQTVAQVLHHNSRIASSIQTHLETTDLLALPPILHSLVAFARDIPDVFYERHFSAFVRQLTSLVTANLRAHDVIEDIFVCFVSLFTLLQKYIKADFYRLYVEDELCVLFARQNPWYIHELAAQALGSLIRKFDNKRQIFTICLKRLRKTEDETDGVGRLLFHTIKSDVVRRLHSSTPASLALMLDLLISKEVPREQSTSAIAACLNYLAIHVTSAADVPAPWHETWRLDSRLVWPVLLARLDECDDEAAACLFRLVAGMLKFKKCGLVTSFDELLARLTPSARLDDDAATLLGQVVADLLNASCCDASPAAVDAFCVAFFSSVSPSVVFGFCRSVVCSAPFDESVLPHYTDFVLASLRKGGRDTEVLRSIVDVISSNAVTVRSALDLELWSRYSLGFDERADVLGVPRDRTPSRLLEAIVEEGLSPDAANLERLVWACFCLPHVCMRGAEEDLVPLLFAVMSDALERLQTQKDCAALLPNLLMEPSKKKRKKDVAPQQEDSSLNLNLNLASDELSRRLVFLVSVALEALYHLVSPEDFAAALADHDLVALLKGNPRYRENVHLLKAIDIHLTVLAESEGGSLLKEAALKDDLYPALASSLASHKPLVRLLVAHIFSLFPVEAAFEEEEDGGGLADLFCVMFETEAAPVTPLEYKERLRLLGRLDPDGASLRRPESSCYDQAPLLFLVGQLFINFKEFWPPVVKLIAKYATRMDEDVFWALWLPKIKLAAHFCMRRLCGKDIEDEAATAFEDDTLATLHSDLLVHPGYAMLSSKPDYLNFRDLLWKAMQQFPEICERRNKDMVSVFFEFLHQELFPADFNVAPTQDVSVHADQNADAEDEEEKEKDEDEKEEEEEEEKIEEAPTSAEGVEVIEARDRIRKAPTKSLCEHLLLFSKFHNPKVIYKSKELEDIYSEFLSHPYPKAQKLALDAVMTYRHKHLTPYKETLYNILDDKTFKNEITLFDIEGGAVEEEGRSLKQEHREGFMPFLMRILYGKMQFKTGGHSSGKGNIGARKGIVLRFLAGANEAELDTFLNLSFDILLSHLEGSALEVVERVERTLQPARVVPLKRLQGALGTLDTIFDKIGSLLVHKRSFMLKVILFILSTCVSLLENRADVCPHFIPLLKTLRQMAMQKVILFFTNYEDYQWSKEELDAVYRCAVWPNLSRLPDEGIYSPTTLLRLFSCWAANPSYHVLLRRHHPEDEALTPMPFVVRLINHPKCSSSVISAAQILIEKLLRGSPDGEEEGEAVNPFPFPLEDLVCVDGKAEECGLSDVKDGEAAVLVCLDDLLSHVKACLAKLKKGQSINKRELALLIHLSRCITRKEDAQELLESIVPLLKKDCVKQSEKVSFLLETCRRLFPVIDAPQQFAKTFLSLFSILNGRDSRTALCLVVEAMFPRGSRGAKLDLAKCCSDLNAWNEETVEEVDVDTRMRGYRVVNQYIREMRAFDEDAILFLVHQNVWVIQHSEDQALNDLSVLCLQNVVDALARLQSSASAKVRKMLERHLLQLLKWGLKSQKESIRNAVLGVLSSVVIKCHALNPRLKDLFALSNATDPDLDFFLNMCHLQHSKRTQALMKLADQLDDGTISLRTDSITEFILPIASVYLFKEEYATDTNLITGSIICLGALARQLPWFHYQFLLKHYLNLVSRELSQLKLGVRVLETIIDAFHEDLSAFDESKLRKGTEEEKKMEEEVLETKEEEEEEEDEDGDGETKEEKFERESSREAKAQKVYFSLTRFFIPQIQKTLAQKSARDSEHKVNKKKYPEDEDIKRIPLALALIKLLKKLPPKLLHSNVSSVFMKLITYLKSKAESIRRESRNMLVKVMQELGGHYLLNLVSDMSSILTLGYQTHVMVFTIHSILVALDDSLLPAHLKSCLSELMEICMNDLFGDKAEEKKVSQLTCKVREMKADKGCTIMGVLAQRASVDQLQSIMAPLKEKLHTNDKKIVNKIITCLQKIGNGLERNTNITIEHKSLFIYSILSEKIKELSVGAESKAAAKATPPPQLIRPDSLLLAPEPRKVGLMPKMSLKSTSHALVEFALGLLFTLLRRERFVDTDKQHCSLLDAYVEIMSDCLLSDYPEVGIQALHVVGYLIRFPLPSLKTHISRICGQMFVILNKFASPGLTKGKIFELVQLDFKILALVIKLVSFYKLETEHSKVLLYYARNNLDDFNQHNSSFVILHALLGRKVNISELHDLMVVIREMSITSPNLNMLDQARRTYLNYWLNYPIRKKHLQEILTFYLQNISYHIPEGRMSSALMLSEIIQKFPRNVFDQSVEVTIWFKLTEQLIKEDSKEHKGMLQKLLKSLFFKSVRKNLFIVNCLKLLQDDLMKDAVQNAVSIHMGAQSLLAMLDVQILDLPPSVFQTLLPEVAELLHPGRYQVAAEADDVDRQAHCLDLALTSLLDLFMQLMDIYFNKKNLSSWSECVGEDVWRFIQDHLLYPNLKVRLNSGLILGRLFAMYPSDMENTPSLASTSQMAGSLVMDLCEQLNTECPIESPMLSELGLVVVRNLIYLIRQSKKVPLKLGRSNKLTLTQKKSVNFEEADVPEDEDIPEDEESSAKSRKGRHTDSTFLEEAPSKPDRNPYFNEAYWVLHRVGVMAYDELRKKGRDSTFRRECLLNLIAAVVVILDADFESATNIISFILHHLTRELSDKRLPQTLYIRTKEVSNLVRERIGVEKYSEEVLRVQGTLGRKRMERKTKTRQMILSNPTIAVNKRAKKQEAKKQSKKRKLAELKLKPVGNKRLKHMAIIKA